MMSLPGGMTMLALSQSMSSGGGVWDRLATALRDIVVGHGVEAGVVGFVLEQAGLIAGDARNIFFVRGHWLSSR